MINRLNLNVGEHEPQRTTAAEADGARDAAMEARPMAASTAAQLPKGLVQRKLQRRLQRRAGGAGEPTGAAAESTAQGGFSGGGGELPHRAAIERSFGMSLAGVSAHVGSEATSASRALGAEAYAMGNRVAFASPNPSLHLAAHEAAHVVQQAAGVHLSRGIDEPGDQYERQADAAADAVVAGRPADMLPAHGGGVGAAGSGPIQRYRELSVSQRDFRVSDDGALAVEQEDGTGGQLAFARPDLIETGSSQLEQARSIIRLEAGTAKFHTTDENKQRVDLVEVLPVDTKHDKKGDEMTMWADCGRAARTVSGGDQGMGHGSGDMNARYKNSNGKEQATGKGVEPAYAKALILYGHLKSQLGRKDRQRVEKLFKQYKVTAKQVEKLRSTGNHLEAITEGHRIIGEINQVLYSQHGSRSEQEQKDTEESAGVNRFADPEIGEAFLIHSGGERHQDLEENRRSWDQHWAGVVLKSSRDTMTLENYATSDHGARNRNWSMQLYGVPKNDEKDKKGQSFHEQHRDEHKQHGQSPTTMVMGPSGQSRPKPENGGKGGKGKEQQVEQQKEYAEEEVLRYTDWNPIALQRYGSSVDESKVKDAYLELKGNPGEEKVKDIMLRGLAWALKHEQEGKTSRKRRVEGWRDAVKDVSFTGTLNMLARRLSEQLFRVNW